MIKHEERRKEILTHALDVFVEEGYESASFQKIAERCGITRTTLYIYFKNKKEVFAYSIKLLLAKVEEGIQRIRSSESLDSVGKIVEVLRDIFKNLEENRGLLLVLLDYFMHISKSNIDPAKRIRRRTLRLRHILASMIIAGIEAGDIKPVSVKPAVEFLNSFIESAIFRLVVLRQESVGDLADTVALAARRFF